MAGSHDSHSFLQEKTQLSQKISSLPVTSSTSSLCKGVRLSHGRPVLVVESDSLAENLGKLTSLSLAQNSPKLFFPAENVHTRA